MSMDRLTQTGPDSFVVIGWTAGTTTVLAGQANVVPAMGNTAYRIRLLGGLLVAGAAGGSIQFQSYNATTTVATNLSGVLTFSANQPVFPGNLEPGGYLQTLKGEDLRASVTGAFNGTLRLQLIP